MRNAEITAVRMTFAGKPTWLYSDGTMLPIVSGGDGTGEGEGEGEGAGGGAEGEGEGEGAEGGEGEGGSGTDPVAEAAKWKDLARKHEARAKANAKAAKELDELRVASMNDNEKAIAEAKRQGRQEATAELSEKIVGARIEAALTGVVPDPAAIVDDLNLGKYVTESGDVDTEAIEALRVKYAALNAGGAASDEGNGNGGKSKPKPDLKQGNRGNGSGGKPQLTRAQLTGMTPEAIEQARLDGQLNDVLGIKT